jgi:peptidoglycan hydrolase-like amidase
MKQRFLRVGLTTGDLVGTEHRRITIKSASGLSIDGRQPAPQLSFTAEGSRVIVHSAGSATAAGQQLSVRAKQAADLTLSSDPVAGSSAKPATSYRGTVELSASNDRLKAVLITDLESYVQGVLQSEVPSYFQLEAMKAQAVVARSYGLHPRLPHDGCDVCDSYLHCQAFYGVRSLTKAQAAAIETTRNEIIVFHGKPALALFSACAGGHTESYQFAFSDPITNAFPPAPISYLCGVSEGQLPAGFPSEDAMRVLYAQKAPNTDDAWSAGNFRWRVTLTGDDLEGHMHHVLSELAKDRQFAPFILPPASEKFGHIKKFSVASRGHAGTVVELVIDTTSGAWRLKKELLIRSAFANPELKLKRLKSARIFFDHSYDHLGLLKTLTISGFGSGHGVGMQQIGAQGLADAGKSYRQIIAHYYPGVQIGNALEG